MKEKSQDKRPKATSEKSRSGIPGKMGGHRQTRSSGRSAKEDKPFEKSGFGGKTEADRGTRKNHSFEQAGSANRKGKKMNFAGSELSGAAKKRTSSPVSNQERHQDFDTRKKDWEKSARSLSEKRLKAFSPKKEVKKTTSQPKRSGMRLNKYIAHSGICSRREADVYIKAGNVQVNGVTVTQMGYMVQAGDTVKFDNSEIRAEKKVYLLLNKPKGYITTTDDPEKRKTVMELIEGATKERIYPVGRLDRNTTGLLLFTNDGDLVKKITHPSSGVRKIYHVTLSKSLTAAHMAEIRRGITLEDGPIEVDQIDYVENKPKSELGVVIHSGRNRIVRRIFEHFGYEVVKLDRVQLGPLTKKNLNRGRWRFLTAGELAMLQIQA